MKTTAVLLLLLSATIPVLAQRGPGPGPGPGPQPGPGSCCLPAATAPLTADEAKWLSFMREEEKLARDVYQKLYAQWKLRIFDNIARSETRHFEAVGALIDRYNATDPAHNAPAGVYTDPNLTSLYHKLMEKGAMSMKDALEVGVLIEKQDIGDLESALKQTTKTDIKTVYTNLLAGSLNHLDSFEHLLEIVP